VLRKDGIIRILVPDLRLIVTEYLANRVYAEDFVEELGVLFSKN
jgi:predicted SAM-dependent methyltransferase